jgi:amidophosphoribosyltransferase
MNKKLYPHEACGVFGAYNDPNAAEHTRFGLYALQHRGQESAGIAVNQDGQLSGYTRMGLASEVLTGDVIQKYCGSSAIGHVRYSTTGSSNPKNAQPLLVDYARGQLAVAHNGNLVNSLSLRRELEASGSIFQTTTDSEIIIHLIARPSSGTMDEVLFNVLRRLNGAYSLALLTGDSLIAARDPYGFRPLSIGKRKDSVYISSETSAFDLIGAELVRDVEPGEIVIFNEKGMKSLSFATKKHKALCVFEYVYFSRPDSRIDGRTVHSVRKAMGHLLAKESPVEADIVVPVPDSGNSAALGYSEESGIPLEFGYVRNHYIGRTFISPTQVERDVSVRVKLNVMPEVVKDKRVIIVDDSIIRGTTTFTRIAELKKAGAKEVHVRISCPPTRYPCFYGVDFPTTERLIAANHSIDEIAEFLHADSLGYLSHDGLLDACGRDKSFCCACYDGNYPDPLAEPFEKEMMERTSPKSGD